MSYKKKELKELLFRLGDHVNNRDEQFLSNFAKEWSVKNTARDKSSLKSLYENGSWDKLFEQFPVEIEMLKSKPIIKEYLETLGYDLPWMEKVYG